MGKSNEYQVIQYASDGSILQPCKGRADPARKEANDCWGKS